jgi:hypothetical protein
MRFRTTAMITSVASAALSVGSLLLLASPASASDEPSTPTVICHGTGSERHPYVVIPPALASLESGHDDDIRLDDGTLLRPLHPEDEGYDTVDCASDDYTGDPVIDTPIDPQGDGDPVIDTPIDPQGDGDPVIDTPIGPQGDPAETTTPLDAEATAAPTTTVDAVADEVSEAGLVPAGGVEAGDGSAAGGGSGVLPYVLGSLALAGAGGAAVASRRSARESD